MPLIRKSCLCRWMAWVIMVRLPMRRGISSMQRTTSKSMQGSRSSAGCRNPARPVRPGARGPIRNGRPGAEAVGRARHQRQGADQRQRSCDAARVEPSRPDHRPSAAGRGDRAQRLRQVHSAAQRAHRAFASSGWASVGLKFPARNRALIRRSRLDEVACTAVQRDLGQGRDGGV